MMPQEKTRMPLVIHGSWHPYIEHLFADPRMSRLSSYIVPRKPFYPIVDHIFRVFSMPINEIKVVVLGQDPYYNGEAIGYAFAVEHNVTMPASLKNILAEVDSEYDADLIQVDPMILTPQWRTLKHWRNQGVFLLNTALTVERGVPNSHSESWSWFTKEVVDIISRVASPIWLMWGRQAQKFEDYIVNRKYYKDYLVSKSDVRKAESDFNVTNYRAYNWIIRASHPATRDNTFMGNNNFFYCNQILKAKNYEPIKW